MYTINEGQFTHPPEWQDKTINVLTLNHDDTPAFSLVITRDTIPKGMRFSDYALQEAIKAERQLPEFEKIEERSDERIDNQPAHYLEYRWTSTEGVLHQIVMMAIYHPQKILIFTASAPNEITDQQKKQVLDMLQSFRFHQ